LHSIARKEERASSEEIVYAMETETQRIDIGKQCRSIRNRGKRQIPQRIRRRFGKTVRLVVERN
jgi:hypothetical protein